MDPMDLRRPEKNVSFVVYSTYAYIHIWCDSLADIHAFVPRS